MNKHVTRSDFAADAQLIRIGFIAAVVGVLSTLAGALLLYLIRVFTNIFFFQTLSAAAHTPASNKLGLWVIPIPVIGGLIIGFMARYGSEKIRGHGIPEAIEAILFGKSRMSAKVAILKPLSSGIAIGSGGPFGAEGPIIMTGGSIGSLIAQYFHLTGAERKTLLVAGAVAGMTAIFGTPIAAVLLAVELLLFELRPRSLLPVAIACAVAGFTRPLLFESGPLFPITTPTPGALDLLSCIVAGLGAGILAWALSTSLYKIEDIFAKLPIHWMWWPAVGGLAIGIGGYFQPRALGVGYDVIGDLLQNHLMATTIITLLSCKAIMWLVALGSGTSGGVLAPLLMLGAALGALVAPFMPGGHPALWPLVFMAATLGGMMRAPIMASVFAFELTHDVNALLPLLAASTVAYGLTVLIMPRSILTEKIARRGYHIYREYGIDSMERHHVEEVMTRDVETIDANLPVGEVRERYFGAHQRHRAFPVTRNGMLIGLMERVHLDEARDDERQLRAADLVHRNPLITATPDETCRAIATRMAVHGVERMPVVESPTSERLVGIISRSDLVKPAAMLYDEEHRREKFISFKELMRRRTASSEVDRRP